MIRFPYKLVPNPKLAKRERQLPLTLFFTFDTGEQIFTYRPTDLALLSGRYIDKIKNDISFLMEYGASKKQVEIYEGKAIAIINDALNGVIKHGEALAKLKNQFEERKTLYKYNKDLNRQLWLDLYCMMFVLETEDELKFSPASNQRKIELLETCNEEQKEFFFVTLENIMIHFSTTFQADIIGSIQMKAEEKKVLDYLTGQITTPSFK